MKSRRETLSSVMRCSAQRSCAPVSRLWASFLASLLPKTRVKENHTHLVPRTPDVARYMYGKARHHKHQPRLRHELSKLGGLFR